MILRTLTLAGVFAALASAALVSPVRAQDAGSWSFGLGAATDNRSKAASKSDGDGYVWGLAEWESASGFVYAGPAFETIRSSTGSDLELSLGAGIRPQFAGFDFDLNAAHKWQVDANPGQDDDAWEFTADAIRSIGPVEGRVRLQHSPDGMGTTKAWTWVELRAAWEISPRARLSAGVGRRDQDNSVDYTGWDAGATFALGRNLDLDVRWFDTDPHGAASGEQYDSAVVVGLSVYF